MKKKIIYLIAAFLFLAISMYAQDRTRIRDFNSRTIFTGSEVFVIDHSDLDDGPFKTYSLSEITNYILSQGSSGISTFADLTDTDITGIAVNKIPKWNGSKWIMANDETGSDGTSDHKFALSDSDTSPGFWDDQVTQGDFIYLDNDGITVGIEGIPASNAEVSAMSNISKIIRPVNLPLVRIKGSPLNNNAQTIQAKGLSLTRQFATTHIEWQLETDFNSLPEQLSNGLDPYLLNFAMDSNGNSVKVAFGNIVNLINAEQYEIIVVPIWHHAHFSLVGENFNPSIDAILRNNIEVYKNGNLINTSINDFSHENDEGVNSISFQENTNVISMVGSQPGGTYGCDGSVIWATTIIYTDPSNGVSKRQRVGFTNPSTSPCGLGGQTGSPSPTLQMINMVNDWPTTPIEGFYFKTDEELRYYYIDDGASCDWGYKKVDGSGGACLQSKQ